MTGELFKGVAYKKIILQIRYPANTLAQLIAIYALFAVVFFGGRAVAGPALIDSLDGIIVGFFLFTMAVVAYSDLAVDLTRESQWGTLEQLYMSVHGFGRVIFVKAVVNVLNSFVWGASVLVLMLLTTGRTLNLNVLTVGPLLIIAILPAVGVGFVFAGLALIYKRIENAFQLVQFAFIGLIAAPVDSYPPIKFLPLSLGSHLLRIAMGQGVSLVDMRTPDTVLATGVGIGYVLVGWFCFRWCVGVAKQRGVMGHY